MRRRKWRLIYLSFNTLFEKNVVPQRSSFSFLFSFFRTASRRWCRRRPRPSTWTSGRTIVAYSCVFPRFGGNERVTLLLVLLIVIDCKCARVTIMSFNQKQSSSGKAQLCFLSYSSYRNIALLLKNRRKLFSLNSYFICFQGSAFFQIRIAMILCRILRTG